MPGKILMMLDRRWRLLVASRADGDSFDQPPHTCKKSVRKGIFADKLYYVNMAIFSG